MMSLFFLLAFGRNSLLTLTLIFLNLQNMEAWEEAKKEISQIPEHPNRLPEGAQENESATIGPGVKNPTARRLSSARVI